MQKITIKTPINQIIEAHPKTIEILMEYGLMCAGCRLAGDHSLQEIKEMYGLSDKDVKDILKKINGLVEKNEN